MYIVYIHIYIYIYRVHVEHVYKCLYIGVTRIKQKKME